MLNSPLSAPLSTHMRQNFNMSFHKGDLWWKDFSRFWWMFQKTSLFCWVSLQMLDYTYIYDFIVYLGHFKCFVYFQGSYNKGKVP
jgi:hypothetical protein